MEYEREITVEVTCTLDELESKLKWFGFGVVDQYDVKDIYMVDKNFKYEENNLEFENIEIVKHPPNKELLKHCILIRNVIEKDKNLKMITYKYKEYNENEEIVNEAKVNCSIESIDEAKELFESINYEELIRVNDHLIVYSNGIDEFMVQLVNNKHIYIEIEEHCNYIDKKYMSIEAMKSVISKYNIPIKDNNYYAKKAEVELIESRQ